MIFVRINVIFSILKNEFKTFIPPHKTILNRSFLSKKKSFLRRFFHSQKLKITSDICSCKCDIWPQKTHIPCRLFHNLVCFFSLYPFTKARRSPLNMNWIFTKNKPGFVLRKMNFLSKSSRNPR